MTFLLGMWLQAMTRRVTAGARARRGAKRARPHRVALRLEALEDRTVPSTFTVTNNLDTGALGDGSLRGEIAAAHSGDTINFAASLQNQTITLTKGELAINKGLDIEGLGANQLTISGNYNSRVFDITASNASVTIAGLTLTKGSDSASGHDGNCIANAGQLTVNNCIVSGNSGGYSNDVIANTGTLTVSHSTLSGNYWGAINNTGKLNFSYSSLSGSNSRAIDNSGTATVSHSTLSGNIGGGGGAIYNYNTGTLTVSYSTLSGNSAGMQGGAIINYGALTINNSTLSGNEAVGQVGWDSAGGAIYMGSGSLAINSSTLSGNRVYGGDSTPGTSAAGSPGQGQGGGLFVLAGTVTIDHSTLAGNEAHGGNSFFGPALGLGGGIYNLAGAGALQMHDTILANNTADNGPDLDGRVTSLGYNLIGNATGGSGFVASDLLNVNPLLGPLQNNGGPTQTMALLAGSPAINTGDNTGAPDYDQRGPGFPRIVGGRIDIGAFEVQSGQSAPVSRLAVAALPPIPADGSTLAGTGLYQAGNGGGGPSLLKEPISLTPSEPAPQLVGEPITWTATVANAPPGLVYQFDVGSPGGPFHVARDFSPDNHFTWAPMQEGNYRIKVVVKDGQGAERTHSAVVRDKVDSRVTGKEAVITPTANPLVALYSVPPGHKGTVHVEFAVAGDNPSWRSTNELASRPNRSTNFFVAGLLPDTTYEMRDVFSDGTTSAPLLFTTGTIPATVKVPPITVVQPPGPGSDLDQDMLFQILARPTQNAPYVYATNLAGQVTWYYDPAQAAFVANNPAQGASLLPGGTVLVMGADSHATLPMSRNVLREIDLAGNPLRETNLAAVNAQLTALGHDIIYSFTHDAQRLPNGQTAVMGLTERTVNINGTPKNYVGNMIVVLDENFQVTWAWDAFDYLDVNRGPVLGEILEPGATEPTAAVPNLPAVDWLHANSISWSPADQNLVLSVRMQDWVIKIDYENGKGDGHIIWRLGQGGDFTVNSTDQNPWFSHQHNAHFIDDSTLIVFDNGNTRRASDPNAHSRGQVWKLDEQTMTASLVVNADMGNYSDRVGSAQALSNGNYSFTSGAQGVPPFIGQSIEVLPDGTKTYVLQVQRALYRSFRVQTLYAGVSDQPAGGGGETSQHSDDSRGLSRGNRPQGDDPPGAEALAKGAEPSAQDDTGTSASLIASGASPDDFQRAVAVALTASSRTLALPPTPTALTSGDVQRLDQLFATGLEDGTSFIMPRSRRGLWSFGDEHPLDEVS